MILTFCPSLIFPISTSSILAIHFILSGSAMVKTAVAGVILIPAIGASMLVTIPSIGETIVANLTERSASS